MISKRFEKCADGAMSYKSPSPCNTYAIPMSLYKFMSSFVTKNVNIHKSKRTHTLTHARTQARTHTRTHTHTHTHTLTGL